MEGNEAEIQVHSDTEDNGSVSGKLSNGTNDSEDDSLLGFEDDLEGDEEEVDVVEAVNSTRNDEEVKTKRKRKQIDPSKRKRIRRILREDELTEVTISAQKEERERLRRLELQRSLAAASSSVLPSSKIGENLSSGTPSGSSRPSTPVAVDVREKKDFEPHVIIIDSDDEEDSRSSTSAVNCGHLKRAAENVNGDLIEIISSDSEVDDVSDNIDGDDKSDVTTCKRNEVDYENSGLHVEDSLNKPDLEGRVLVNVSHPANEEDIFLAPQIARVIKAHQIGGIRFLYDNLVETLKRFEVSTGFGCILAHSMGLGKTLQVVSFIDIFLRYTTAKKVLCVVPINTIHNWQTEFNMWLPPKPALITDSNGTFVETSDSSTVRYREFEVYLLGDNHKTTMARAKVIGEWNHHGGVLLMGYELYRLLSTVTPSMSSAKSMPTKKKKSPTLDKMNGEPEVIDLDEEEKHMELLIGVQRALCKPGADLVICDEGHRIKNDQANTSQALKKIHTRRRVVLTGYPLQNNLQEYWCMVDFVRPNFLGTKQEFCNMFERPILNGQCSDSTPSDVKIMRYRAHVLHSLLEGFVQRRSQAVLTRCLPVKEEHIILVNMSAIQKELYNTFVDCLLRSVGYINPIKGFHTCTKIWNHPDIFYHSLDIKDAGRTESPLTILEDSNGSSQSSKRSSPSNLMPATTSTLSQEPTNSSNAGVSQNHSSGSAVSCYFPSSATSQTVNTAPISASSQPNSQSGQAVTITTQSSLSGQDTSVSVIQTVAAQIDRSCVLVGNMTWAKTLFKDYHVGVMKNGGKLVVLMEIIEESLKLGEKILIFSQSLSTLSVIEEFLSKRDVPFFPGRVTDPGKSTRWAKNKSYYRLDGNTSAQERERLINRFNALDNTDVLLFMLSTRAGCLGINLVGASRVVVFDASWNPCHDVQAVCRVYRYGQLKPVHIYRLISTGTMEKKIYDRQISKQGMANRIVDELNPEANFTKQEIMKLICEKEASSPTVDLSAAADQFSDPVLVRLCRQCNSWISKVPFKHDSLLVDRKEMKLTKAEKREAKRGYEIEKRLALQGQKHYPGVIQPVSNRNNQPFVPKPVYPVGSVPVLPQTTGLNCTYHHHHHHHPPQLPPSSGFHLPLASFIRAGVPVPSTQFASSAHHGIRSAASPTQSQGNQLGNQEASTSKDDVVMIDLDELPSPTHPEQKTIVHLRAQAHQSQSNADLVRMAQHAFPSVSAAFINVLLNQGNSQGTQESSAQSSHVSNSHGSQFPIEHRSQSSTVRCKENPEASDIDVNSSESNVVESTASKKAEAIEKNIKVKTVVVNTPSQEQTELQSSSSSIIVEVSLGSEQLDLSSQQETTGVSLSPTRSLMVDDSKASAELANSPSQETDVASP